MGQEGAADATCALALGIWLPSRTGLAGANGLETNVLITKHALNAALMGYNHVKVFNNYLVVGSSLLGN